MVLKTIENFLKIHPKYLRVERLYILDVFWPNTFIHIHICVLNIQLHITQHCHCLSELFCSNLLQGSGSLCFAASKGPFIYQINADSSAQPCSAAEWRCRLVHEKYTAFLEKNEHWNLSNKHFCDQPALKAPIQQHRPSSLGLLFYLHEVLF